MRRILLIAAFFWYAAPLWAAYLELPKAVVDLVDGASIPVDASAGGLFTLTITGASHTISNPTNLSAAGYLNFIITQNSTGGFSPKWDTEYTFPYGPPVYNSGPNQVSVVNCAAVSTTSLVCGGTSTSGVTNVFTSNSAIPTAANLYPGNSRLSILSPRIQLLNGLK